MTDSKRLSFPVVKPDYAADGGTKAQEEKWRFPTTEASKPEIISL